MRTIRIGSRESRLAVVQSELVQRYLQEHGIDAPIITMKTTGDKILDRTLDQVGGKGLFVKELDAALLDGRSDISVHSLKDVPAEENPRLPLIGYSDREDPRDVLVLPEGETKLNEKLPIGCSSRRRVLQAQKLYPQMGFRSVRGNVLTRLKKLDDGECIDPGGSRLKKTGTCGSDFQIFYDRGGHSMCRTGCFGIAGP